MTDITWTLQPEQIEWEMDWSQTRPDGTRVYPDQPLSEMVFEEDMALAHLLMNEVIFYNQKLYVNCNDIFAWGCADAEELKDDIERLYRLWRKEPRYGAAAWCIIQRREMPQSPVAKRMKECGWDLEWLAKEHDIRPNIYSGISLLVAKLKYDLYCAWENSRGKIARVFDAGWWEGWNEYKKAHPEFKEYEGPFHEECMQQREAWLTDNGFSSRTTENES